MMQKILLLTAILLPTFVWGADLRGRVGIGMTNQLANEIPAISFKIQQSKTMAFGGLLGFKSDNDNTLYGVGVKAYRIIFDEPQLNFYFGGLLASESFLTSDGKAENGFQLDGVFGSEFHFQGLDSLGFSLEFGVSVRKGGEAGTTFQTLGDNFLKGAVHFYL